MSRAAEGMTAIDQIVAISRTTGATGWDLVAQAQQLVHERMAYSYDNSFDRPVTALAKGRGYCWQQASVLRLVLRRLGFDCWLVYATRVQVPDRQFQGVTVPAHESGHAWCQVGLDGVVKDVCSGDGGNTPGRTHFTVRSPVKRWNAAVCAGSYLGSAIVNRRRLREINRLRE